MQLEVGSIIEGTVSGITKFGAFVDFPEGQKGMVHISEIAPNFVEKIEDYVKEGQTVKVKVIDVKEGGKVGLSIKKAMVPPSVAKFMPQRHNKGVNTRRPAAQKSFDDMLSKFMQSSEEKICDIKKSDSRRGSSRRGHSK